MRTIDLNCDLGEGFDTDAAIMPFISSANIACGYHAGDSDTIMRTIALAQQHGVAIGAHPGFADKANFGRVPHDIPDDGLYELIAAQLHVMATACSRSGAVMTHVKPHGALYNMAAASPRMARVICKAVKDAGPQLRLYGLSNSWLVKAAEEAGLQAASEVFADRTYQPDGSLTPRSQADALIKEEAPAIRQVIQMVTRQEVTTVNGQTIPLAADTICLHGDNAHAVAFARTVRQALQNHHISIQHN